MVYLDERNLGFDPTVLGFPSIHGCHAIVLHTSNGLYGFHNYGGERPDAYDKLSKGFAAFVKGHNRYNRRDVTHLYGTCFRTTTRGYATDQENKWKAEMTAFAKELKYKGPISGYNLDDAPDWPNIQNSDLKQSAYVVYHKIFDQCYIQYAVWSQMNQQKGAIPDAVHRKTMKPSGEVVEIATTKNTIGVTLGGLSGYVRATLLDTFNY